MKYFRWTEEYILNSSWIKMMMYSATIPDYSIDKKKQPNSRTPKEVDATDLEKYFT